MPKECCAICSRLLKFPNQGKTVWYALKQKLDVCKKCFRHSEKILKCPTCKTRTFTWALKLNWKTELFECFRCYGKETPTQLSDKDVELAESGDQEE